MNQVYRDRQGYLVVLDLTNEAQVSQAKEWVAAIEQRCHTKDRVIFVLGNKMDLYDDIDQAHVCHQIENELIANHPEIIYREISVKFNVQLQQTMEEFASAL